MFRLFRRIGYKALRCGMRTAPIASGATRDVLTEAPARRRKVAAVDIILNRKLLSIL